MVMEEVMKVMKREVINQIQIQLQYNTVVVC